jgi:hypothetical protein
VQWLEQAGLKLRREVYSEKDFGNWLRELVEPGISIRIVRDRLEWFVEASPGSGEWYGIEEWSSCLGQRLQVNSPVSDAMEFVRDNIPRMRAAARSRPRLEACLQREHAMVMARSGGPPDLGPNEPAILMPPKNAETIRREAAARLARERRRRKTN